MLALLVFAAPLSFCQAPAQPAPPQPSGSSGDPMKDLQAKVQQGFDNFNNGQFEAAIGNFEEVIKGLGPGAKGMQQLEGVYFTRAAAYFNTNNYSQALESFKQFLVDYPKTSRLIDAQMAIAQCLLLLKNYSEAEKIFSTLENIPSRPDLREQALMLEATAYRDDKQIDKAIERLEKLIAPDTKTGPKGAKQDIRTPLQANGATMLMELYLDTNPARVLELLFDLQTKILLVENVVTLNNLAIKIGDSFYNKKLYNEAFRAYRAVKLRNEIIKVQQQRIAALEAQIEKNRQLAQKEANPAYMNLNVPILGSIANAKKLLEEMQKLPDFGPKLYFRIANCYYELGKKWEAIVVYDELFLRFPNASPDEKENAMFAQIAIMTETSSAAEIGRMCDLYVKTFPQGKNKDTVTFFKNASLAAAEQFDVVEKNLEDALKKATAETKFRAEMTFQLGYARFAQSKFEAALNDFKKYQQQFGLDSPNGEDAFYLSAVCLMFTGKLDEAYKTFEAYTKKYPAGNYITDAKYRMIVCNLSFAGAAPLKEQPKKYEGVVTATQEWEKEFGKSNQLGDVLASQGDALVALDRIDEAIESYIRSWKSAKSDELISYSLFEANKHLQKKGQWERIGKMFTEFVQMKGGDHPVAATAMYWIGRAKAKEGKVDEAKQFMADTIQKYIGDKKVDAVEMLETQLAQLIAKKKPATPAPGAPTPTPAPEVIGLENQEPKPTPKPTPVPIAEPLKELEKYLAASVSSTNPTVQARVIYAKAAVAEARKNTEEHDKFIVQIAEKFKPEDLSATLLAQIGDYLLNKGEQEKAIAFYTAIMDEFPKSDVQEYAYAGLGEIAFQRKEYDKALDFFTDAIEKIGAGAKLRDCMVGKAKTLYEMGKLEEAKKLFLQIVNVREWRGETTAYCLFMLGQVDEKQEKIPEAIGRYQKVFVGFQKYLPWVAKSYLRASDCFVKLGEPKKAAGHLEEMLRNQKLEKLPEYNEAKKRLAELNKAAELGAK